MSGFWLELTLQEPLIVGEMRIGANALTTLPYIPGRVLRGAWAGFLIAQGRTAEITPLTSQARIGNFFPAVQWTRPVRYATPHLFSTLTCKAKPGFATEPETRPDKRGHGSLDSLLPQLAYQELTAQGAQFPVPFQTVCKKCEEVMERAAGYYTAYDMGAERKYAHFSPRYHAQTKVAISRQRRAASEGLLYTVTALSPQVGKLGARKATVPLTFFGQVFAEKPVLDELLQALQHTPLGALSRRGYGSVQAKTVNLPGFGPLSARLEAFNQVYREKWTDLRRLAINKEALPAQPGGIYFSVDLLSPGIFQEDHRPALAPVLNLGGQALAPTLTLTRPGFAGGWSSAWNMPKPTQLAAQAGSVYVYRWAGEKSALLKELDRIEVAGMGLRCDEGFGECVICHPFHQEVSEK